MALELSQFMPLAANYPNPKDTGTIPSVFSDQVNAKYYQKDILPVITNSKWKGALAQLGDEVIIPQRPDVAWKKGKLGEKETSETLQSLPVSFRVNRFATYDFTIPVVTKNRQSLNWGAEGVLDTTLSMAGMIQADFFVDIANKAAAENCGDKAGKVSQYFNMGKVGAPLAVNTKNIISFITAFRTILEEQNAAQANRMWIALPAVFRHKLINSDLRKAMEMGDGTSVLRNGEVGTLDQTKIIATNAIVGGLDAGSGKRAFWVVGGNMDAISYAAWVINTEKIPSNEFQGDRHRGTVIYDWKVVKAEGLVAAYIYVADET